ncbi:hypothetical protein QUF44_13025 [Bacillus subtilis]|nr:hypothetical protein [Bacillus subtilis]MDM5302498.1 hypothetical protein [Bacillus subtilis]MDM5324551.1 hypothetical protein [Bacillus subtilis]
MKIEDLAIKLKDDYLILINPRNKKEVIVLDKVNEKVILKFNINDALQQFHFEFDKVINHFTSMQALSKSIEGKLILKLYSGFSHLFELENFCRPALKQDYIKYEFTNTINPLSLFETYKNDEENKYKIVIWGINEVSLTLINSLTKIDIPIMIMRPFEEEIKDIQFKKSIALNGFETEEDLMNSLLTKGNIHIFEEQMPGEANELIHIIDNRLLELELVKQDYFKNIVNDQFVLHYGFYSKEFTLGPLVLKGESYGYEDFTKQYNGRLSLPTVPQSLIISGLIARIVYFLIRDTLKFLAQDVQLPINQVFSFHNDSFNSSIIDIEGVV